MAKKAKATPAPVNPTTQAPAVTFPNVSSKEELACRVLLEDQILVIDVRPGGVSVLRTSRSCIPGFLLSGRMQIICEAHRRSAVRTDPAEEERGGRQV